MRISGRGFLHSVVLSVFCMLLWAPQGNRSAAAATAAPAVESGKPNGLPPVAQAKKVVLTDRDGDGVSDGFQERLADLPPTTPVDVVVTFTGKGNADAVQKVVGPFKVKKEFRIIRGFAATVTAAQARALGRAQGVFRVEEDFQVSAMLDASRKDFGINAIEGWSTGLDGTGIGICVVDTGADPGHEQLDDGKIAAFADFVGTRTDPYDDHGHGTHVAAIAAGDGTGGSDSDAFHGVAPRASVYAAKVLDAYGSGSDSDVIAGVQWCAEQPGVHIISMSLGSTGSSDGQDSLSQAVNNAVAVGKSVVVAAGNSGDGLKTVGSPGASAQAVTVGAAAEWSAAASASNHSDGIYLAPFSSRGPTADERLKPDVIAPGVSVTSARAGTTNGYVTWSGTSMATPFVSGALALALQTNPELTPGNLKGLLLSTAQDRGATGADNDWGAGLLDGAGLIAAAGSLTADPTAFPLGERKIGTVPDNGEATFSFEITEAELGVPLAVTVTMEGELICLYGSPAFCDILGGWAWTPDLDAELIHPSGSVVSESLCPLLSECGALGRQETLHYLPVNTGDTGTYTVRIYPYEGEGGNVALDVSIGPVTESGGSVNKAPVADAGPDQSVTDSDENGSEPVTLDGSSSSDPDGTISSYAWTEGSTQIAAGSTPTVTLDVGTHTITLTVTDDDGATASDTLIVTVNEASNQPPVANAGPDQNVTDSDGNGSEPITLDGSGSSDPDGTISSYLWTEGSTQIAAGANPTVTLDVGTHTITLTVTDNDGATASDTVAVTVNAGGGTTLTMHVGDLDGANKVKGKSGKWEAYVTVTIHDQDDSPVANAAVTVTWSGDASGTASGTTNGSGIVTFGSGNLNDGSSVTFTVADVNLESYYYDDGDNHDPDGDSNGTWIMVNKQ